MFDFKNRTIDEIRGFYREQSEDSPFISSLVQIRLDSQMKNYFDGLMLYLLSTSIFPNKIYLNAYTNPNINSLRSNITRNGNKTWNLKFMENGDEVYQDCLFNERIEGDGRKLSQAFRNYINSDEFINMTVDVAMQTLLNNLESQKSDLPNHIEVLNEKISKFSDVYETIKTYEYSREGNEKGPYTPNSIEKEILERIERGFKQIVLTGAPGTGKTYSIQNFIKNYAEKHEEVGYLNNAPYRFVQFHSSYDYTDFVEGFRPVQLSTTGKIAFVKVDGAFKKFCREVAEANNVPSEETNDLKYFFVIDEINRADLAKVFGELMYGLEENYRETLIETQYMNLPTYKIGQQGAELLTEDVFADGFYIPDNVYILASMNDIDRSVESLDFALRRRFQWLDVRVNNVLETTLQNMQHEEKINSALDIQVLKRRTDSLNQYISEVGKMYGLNEAYHIGPAYLISQEDSIEEALQDIWKYRVGPILKEYCRGFANSEPFIQQCKSIFIAPINQVEEMLEND